LKKNADPSYPPLVLYLDIENKFLFPDRQSPPDSLLQIHAKGVKAEPLRGTFGNLDVFIQDLFFVYKRALLSFVRSIFCG